jgi:hypothetical protein
MVAGVVLPYGFMLTTGVPKRKGADRVSVGLPSIMNSTGLHFWSQRSANPAKTPHAPLLVEKS